jgi:amino-acid N-acetyltransferase
LNNYFLRKARISDVRSIHSILMDCSKQELLLPRSYSDLYSHLRDYYVIARDQEPGISGCCALSIVWENLAEVRSLAIVSDLRGQGWGRKLVEACLSEAITLGIYSVFTLTYQVAFFARLGFVEISKDVLPQKVWADCLRCPKFPDCDETAMLMEM